MNRLLALGAVLGLSSAVAVACRSITCEDNKTCTEGVVPGEDAGGDGGGNGEAGGSDGGSDAKVPPSDCLPSPSEKADVVRDECGVFVAGSGVDTNAGTKASPVKTVEQAAKIAKRDGKAWVFVCSGAYTEATVAVEGDLGVFGGFDCASWSVGTTRAVVEGKDPGAYVFSFKNGKARLEQLEIHAKDADQPGQSSIAVFVNGGSLDVVGSVIKAGNGKDGLPGGDAGAPFAQKATQGKNSDGAGGGGGNTSCSCPDGFTVGGTGGTVGGNESGGAGTPDLGASPPDNGAGGTGNAATCANGGYGHNGAAGRDGDAGANASSFGALAAAGWEGTNGNVGMPGTRAQGGGGGGARSGGGGGGGGCGGCGGAAGLPGAAGGASAAIIAMQASVTCTNTRLATGNGGSGGAGSAGQSGQQGGNPGLDLSANGCNGGNGGNGGGGGHGGGGAGGLSVGVLYKGPRPSLANTVFDGGTPGTGGTGGSGSRKDGVVADMLEVN